MPATQTDIHPSGINITFSEEGHTYIDGMDIVYESVTTFTKRFFPVFDSDRIAKEIGARTGQDPESILAEWASAGRYGTRVHEIAEDAVNRRAPRHVPESETERLSMSCAWETAQDMVSRWTVIGCEQIVFSPRYRIAGTVDLLMHDGNTLWILDWKTNKEIHQKAWDDRRAFPPIGHVPDANWFQYSLQLSMYERIIRDDGYCPPGTTIKRALLHVTPSGVRWIHVPNMAHETAEMLLTTMQSTINGVPF